MSFAVENRASPNFNARRGKVNALVLHYTGMDTAANAIDLLCNKSAQVSSHYVLEEDGTIWRLVDENKRAWHAGRGSWRGETDMNSVSVGIEIVNGGHNYGLPEFPEEQIKALIVLSREIIQGWKIPQTGILAHSDMAPERKLDPGERFPWHVLAKAGIGLWPDDDRVAEIRQTVVVPEGSTGFGHVKNQMRTIGYGLDDSDEFTPHTRACVAAFQRRWRQNRVTGLIDEQTAALIAHIAELSR